MREIKVGASKFKLTPPEKLFPIPVPEWFGGGEYGSVKDDIYVRVVAIDNSERTILLICGELGTYINADEIKTRIKNELGIPENDILICATHTHEVPEGKLDPDIKDDAKAGINRKRTAEELRIEQIFLEYNSFIANQSFLAAKEALKNRVPVRYGYGEGKSYINVSRDGLMENNTYDLGINFERPSDKTLAVLKFEDMEGKLIAVIINYAVHNSMCYQVKDTEGKYLMIYADISGEVSKFIEERYAQDGTVAMWTNGAAGNQDPIWVNAYHRFNQDKSHNYRYYQIGHNMFGLCEHVGQTQAIDVIRILDSIKDMHSTGKITMSSKMFNLPGTKVVGFTREVIMNSALLESNMITNVPSDPVPLGLVLITIGDVALYGINGEVMCETGLRIKERSSLKKTIVISLVGNNPAGKYLVDDWGYENHTFEYYRNTVEKGAAEKCILENLEIMLAERSNQ
jgi:neutral ceramidase